MDWFTALEGPTQVAIVGVLLGLVSAGGAVAVAIVNNRRRGGGQAEIAAMTIDSSAVMKVAAAMEALNLTLIEQNRVGDEVAVVVKGFTDQIRELRLEVRALSDKLRTRP